MTRTPYDKAVEQFDALMSAPRQEACPTPASLIQKADMPLSSGYRHVANLEAESFLRRDVTGVYLPGSAALGCGLKAFGAGDLVPRIPPVLLGLRQATQHTSFVAMVCGSELVLGPYSLGRLTENTVLGLAYLLVNVDRKVPRQSFAADLLPKASETGRRLSVCLCPATQTGRWQVMLGLVRASGRRPETDLTEALQTAVHRLTENEEDMQ